MANASIDEKRLNFTKTAIEALPLPESERVEYRDIKTAGLQIRVSPSGVKTFYVYRRVKGANPERIKLGRFPDISVEQARNDAAQINAKISSGANPAEARRAHKAEFTFAALFKQYMDRHAKLRKKTSDEDQQRYEQYLEKKLGSKKISAITQGAIARIHSDITTAGHPTVANRVLALISSIFGRGIEFGLTKDNPALGIRRNREESRDRFLAKGELPRFFAALEDEPNETVRDFFYMCLLTGARRANVLEMEWGQLDLESQIWRIPNTKNNAPQNVHLSDDAVGILNNRKKNAEDDAEFVFPGTGASGHLVEPRKGWERLLKNASLTNLRIHDLRRTLGSWQAMTGASMPVIGKSLGHKSQQTTAIYARLDLDPVRTSVNNATKAMMDAANARDEGTSPEQKSSTPTK